MSFIYLATTPMLTPVFFFSIVCYHSNNHYLYDKVPFWARLRHVMAFKAVLKGVNATAIGLVGAACVTLWESAIEDAADAMVFCLALTLAVVFSIQAPFVILAGGVLGALLHPDVLDLGQVPYCLAGGEYIENPADQG